MPRFPLRPHDCLSRRVVRHGHPSLLKGSHLGCWKFGLSEAEPGSLAAPRGLLGSTLPQPILTPQLPPTPEGPVTAIRELGVPSLRPEGGGGAPTASCVCTPPRLMVQQELWGACVHSRDTQDGSRAPPGQEATEPGGRPGPDF